ncbi:MAG: flagellar motor protein MotB [Candidatus Omnitrophica bacterium]|nr:flagellar motor protein MotB [Candidatus Omnitrophota bacterium]
MKNKINLAIAVILVFGFCGCSTVQKANRAEQLQAEVDSLNRTIEQLQKTKESELDELERAKKDLEDRLSNELLEYKAKLKMTEEGLMVTFLAEVFFDSGKAEMRSKAEPTLVKVASVLNDKVAEYAIVIQGHTDNEPIKYSSWKSNWELASARALAVVHFFIDECSIDPLRLSAVSYGEYKPVDTNDTEEGRQNNRRVEIIIKKKSAE